MNYDNDIIDSERDCDVPRRFRRTSSCGSERTCGAEDCSSCYPAGFDSNHAKEDEDDDNPNSGSHFADVVALLDAIKNVAHRPSEAASILSMVAKARNAMTLALETLEEERAKAKQEDEDYVRVAKVWLARMQKAEAELVTLRHVHRPVVIFAEGVTP